MNAINKSIVVAGLVCIDITPEFNYNTKLDLSSCFQPGKLIRTKGVTVSAGGAVANTGLALAKLGAKVHLMYMVGNDSFGEMVSKQLNQYHVSTTPLKTDKAATSYSVILAFPGYDRIILHDVGANDILSADDFDYDVIHDACIFHFGYPQSMRKFYINNADELVYMYKRVHNMGVATSLDMALADMSSESSRIDWKHALKNLMPYVDIFAPSLEELCQSMDLEQYKIWNNESYQNGKTILDLIPNDYIEYLANQLISWGARIVLIKCGTRGMYLQTASQAAINQIGGGLTENLKGWGNQHFWMPCFRVDRVCSGTGAGDTSIAGFLYSIQRGYPIKRCVEIAAATGALCVTSYDTLSNIVSIDEINQKIKDGWETVT
jgi:sugar/nucleoside kinase (ribokinase family)